LTSTTTLARTDTVDPNAVSQTAPNSKIIHWRAMPAPPIWGSIEFIEFIRRRRQFGVNRLTARPPGKAAPLGAHADRANSLIMYGKSGVEMAN
jgi:hypothetical protein